MVRLVDFYRAPALKVCKFCGQLHDIMTDELIISKFHWMSHMGEKKPAGIPTLRSVQWKILCRDTVLY